MLVAAAVVGAVSALIILAAVVLGPEALVDHLSSFATEPESATQPR